MNDPMWQPLFASPFEQLSRFAAMIEWGRNACSPFITFVLLLWFAGPAMFDDRPDAAD